MRPVLDPAQPTITAHDNVAFFGSIRWRRWRCRRNAFQQLSSDLVIF